MDIEIDLTIPDHDLIIEEDVLALYIFRQDGPVRQPRAFFYKDSGVLTLERNPVQRLHFPLVETAQEKISDYTHIMIVEVDEDDDPKKTLSYLAPIEILVWKPEEDDTSLL